MKRLGLLILGLALFVACSKDEEKELVDNSEPVVPMTNYVMTGVFEGEWVDMATETIKGSITVNNEYIIIDEFPAEGILKRVLMDVHDVYLDHPEIKEELADSIGNILFAESYKYPKTDLEIKYQIDSYSRGFFTAKASNIKNMWSDIRTFINTDYEPPYSGETIVIDPAEPNTISFSVEADGVPYRIDLVSKEHECIAEFNMNTGLWRLQYWFNTYRFNNLQTGQQWDMKVVYSLSHRHDKEDTIPFSFNSTKLIGSVEERVVFH